MAVTPTTTYEAPTLFGPEPTTPGLPVEGPVLAAGEWATNGHLIADVARLWLDPAWRILDPTYGRGVWWQLWQPAELVAHDLHTLDGIDFRQLPHEPASFDAVAFDPPYVSVGGRATTTLPDLHNRYGIDQAATTPKGVQADIDAGLTEAARVVRPGGVVLVKCQDYVSSGRFWPGTHHTLTTALTLGIELVDRFEHVTRPRPQPGGRRQVHARRNLSTLLVLRRGVS
jgi:hypothetical protein